MSNEEKLRDLAVRIHLKLTASSYSKHFQWLMDELRAALSETQPMEQSQSDVDWRIDMGLNVAHLVPAAPSAAPEPPTDSFTSDGPISSDPIERCAQIADAVAKSLKRLAEAHPEGEEQAYDCTYGAGVAEDIAAQIRGTRPPTPPPTVAQAIARLRSGEATYRKTSLGLWGAGVRIDDIRTVCDAAASREALSVDAVRLAEARWWQKRHSIHYGPNADYSQCGCESCERIVELERTLGGSK